MVLEALVKEGALTADEAGLAKVPRKEQKKPGGKKAPPPPSILFTPAMLVMPKSIPKPPAPPTANTLRS